jgi:GTP cyclohydrolase I
MLIEYKDEWFSEEELENTPKRIERFLDEWERNNKFNFTVFKNPGYDQMVILKNIEFSSICSHHLLPFHGSAHVGYVPDTKLCGISKLARVVDKFANKPQIQERLTDEIANYLMKRLDPKGVMVVLEASHDCMRIRGVKKQHSVMVTSAIRGVFKNLDAREEFLRLTHE